MPVHIDDTLRISITEIRARSRLLHGEHGIGLIIVDSLELMGGQKGDTPGKEIAQGLKSLARELNLPVLALSQLE
ncbi:MAG: replicative DNA helicase, partial [Gemmatimonadetes bacterium]|nr:replicative DNA helicase [Gemmatimonadota bacterium]